MRNCWYCYFLKRDFIFVTNSHFFNQIYERGERVDGFESVFLKNREFVFRFLVKLTRDASLAEELTEETFYRAYMNFSSLRDRDKASAWLLSIAKNAYYADYNFHKRLAPMEEIDGQAVQEDHFMREENIRVAEEAVSHLPEPYKQVFLLSVYARMSFKEISRAFSKSESWARVTFFRAKQKLIEKMEE